MTINYLQRFLIQQEPLYVRYYVSLTTLINTKYPTIRGGFIHVPFLPEQTIDKPTFASMSLEAITDSLFYMIEAAVKRKKIFNYKVAQPIN